MSDQQAEGHQCYHCKQWVEAGEAHDCWTTTEAALTADLSEELRDAWARLREAAMEFGDQRVYASHKSIMFSRKSCYFFVRPKKRAIEVVFFLGRTITSPVVRRTDPASRAKIAHFVDIAHRDQVEAPFTDWLLEAYEYSDAPRPVAGATPRKVTRKKSAVKVKAAKKKTVAKVKKATVKKAKKSRRRS